MKKRILALVAAVVATLALTTTTASANVAPKDTAQQRGVTCTFRVASTWSNNVSQIFDSFVSPQGVHRHDLDFKLFVNYDFCDNGHPGGTWVKIYSIQYKVFNQDPDNSCHNEDVVDSFVVNANAIGSSAWNPGSKEWDCSSGTGVYAATRVAPNNLQAVESDPANERCIGMTWKVREHTSGDHDGNTPSVCLI